jgi:hypothetical protein
MQTNQFGIYRIRNEVGTVNISQTLGAHRKMQTDMLCTSTTFGIHRIRN